MTIHIDRKYRKSGYTVGNLYLDGRSHPWRGRVPESRENRPDDIFAAEH